MEHQNYLLFALLLLLCLPLTTGCGVPGRDWLPPGGDSGTTDPSCPDPGSIVPDITCGSAQPDRVCAGSCAQTLDGIVGVGLSSCRCVDTGSGFGGQWVCDTTGCDTPTPDDAGTDTSTVSPPDSSVTSDADVPMCPPATFDPPSEPGCTTSQLYEIMRIESQSQYDAFVADPDNVDCNNCMSLAALACGTARGCDSMAGDLLCCLEDNCGDDDVCRDAAFSGACGSQTDDFTYCVSSIGECALNPLAPPAECFP